MKGRITSVAPGAIGSRKILHVEVEVDAPATFQKDGKEFDLDYGPVFDLRPKRNEETGKVTYTELEIPAEPTEKPELPQAGKHLSS